MNIYIEGPDAIGKTTLADKISKRYGFAKVHIGAKEPNDFGYYSNLVKNTNYLIYDRFCVGEIVYSALYNREPRLTFDECVNCINAAAQKGDILVILNTYDPSMLVERFKSRGEFNYIQEATAQCAQYHVMRYCLQAFECPTFIFYNVENGYDELYNKVFDLIEKGW